MFPLFETLAIIDGKIQRIEYHQARMDVAFKGYFQQANPFALSAEIKVPSDYQVGLIRCRVDYSATDIEVNFYPYQPRQICRFRLVETADLDYRFKYADRKRLDLLKNLPNFDPHTDEIIIINNGFISDCSIGNLLFLKQGKWYSPAHYLLKGTQLSYLLEQGTIELMEISADDLASFERIMLINALNSFNPDRAIELTSGLISK